MMNAILQIKDLCKTYGSGVQALKGVSLDIQQGDFFALLGPNGAGKSTLIGILTSLVNKTSGQVVVNGYDIDQQLSMAKQQIGVVPQEYNFSIFEKCIDIIVNQAGYYGITRSVALARAEELLKRFNIWDKRDQISRRLSGGMKRRLMIARALVHKPKILLLDEPTAGVDIELRHAMWQDLKYLNEQEGTTIILTTHYLEEAEELCRNIAIINHGQVVENTSMKALLSQLDGERLIISCSTPIDTVPVIDGYQISTNQAGELLVDIHKTQVVTDLVEQLKAHGIEVNRIRNKMNRLESLFLSLTGESYV